MFVGVPGQNWSDPSRILASFWNGKNPHNLRVAYDQWLENRRAIEPIETAVAHRMRTLDEPGRIRLWEARELVLEALADDEAECVRELRFELAKILNATDQEVADLSFSTVSCQESPTLTCIYAAPIERGASCLFCRLPYR